MNKLLILGKGSGGGTADYNELENKPKINGIELEGDVKIDFGTMKKSVVDSLPTEDIDENTIYLVKKETTEGEDVYDEYMYVNNAWEHIGSTKTDLSDYYTKEEVDEKIDGSSKSWYGTEEEFNALEEYDETGETAYFIEGEVTSKDYVDGEISRVEGEIPSLEGYATETWVDGKGYLVQSDIANKADKSEIPSTTQELVFELEDGTTETINVYIK